MTNTESNNPERWVNREDEDYGGAYRVEGPYGEGVFLVRADSRYRAAEILVEDHLELSIVDEAVEKCHVTPAHDAEAPGLRNIDVYPERREYRTDGEYEYWANWDGPAYCAGVVGYSDDGEREAVENLLGGLRALGVAGSVRICPPFEPEPVPLSEWRARPDEDEEVA